MPWAGEGEGALRPRRRPYLMALLACLSWRRTAEGKEGVQGTIKYLWPIHFSSVPLTTKDKGSLDPPELGEELEKIGLAAAAPSPSELHARVRAEEYVKKTLPQELKLDEQFAQEFQHMDHSRVNLAFGRWQKRVFSENTGVPVEEVSQFGEYIPQRLEGINYSWPELYESRAFKRLRARIVELARLYNRRSGFPANGTADGQRFRIFTWVEVFGRGDALRPGSRTDSAYMMGRYFAAASKGSLKLNFEDPRGINPPYGKTFSHAAYDGNLVLYPSWVSHFITPNMFSRTAVCYCFLVYPEGGKTLDWQDDRSASLVITRNFQASRKRAEK